MPDPTLGNLAPGDVFAVTYRSTVLAQTCLNVLHYTARNVSAAIDRWAAYSVLKTALAAPGEVQPKLVAVLAGNVLLDDCTIQLVNPSRKLRRVFGISTNGGWGGSDCSTPNVAASIQKTADGSGRQFIGRMQVGGVPTSSPETLDGIWGAPFKAHLDDLALAMTHTLVVDGVADFLPCLIGTSGTPPVGHINIVVDCAAKSTIRVMRRRTVGLGI